MSGQLSETHHDLPATQSSQLTHRETIRLIELEQVVRYFPQGARVLEIGAGAGWQARELARRGFDVVAIDVPQSNYTKVRVHPVIDYDGENIPLPDGSVDVVFSSNVLEHVPHIERFQTEMQRVLRPEGIAVHVMPTTAWRFWTSVTFFPDRLKKLALKLRSRSSRGAGDAIARGTAAPAMRGRRRLAIRLRNALLPPRHGERGNILTELYWFSSTYWLRLFRRTGWTVVATEPNGLLYSGQRLFGHLLTVDARRTLSRCLGSSCRIYVLRPPVTSERRSAADVERRS